jgi:hypothetical protein
MATELIAVPPAPLDGAEPEGWTDDGPDNVPRSEEHATAHALATMTRPARTNRRRTWGDMADSLA